MEYFLAAITKFLVDQIGFFFLKKARRDSRLNAVLQEADEDGDSQVTLHSPRAEYLEAMFGDLIEWQKNLQRQGLPRLAIFGLTTLAIGECTCGMLRITLQSLIEGPLHHTSEDLPDDSSECSDDSGE